MILAEARDGNVRAAERRLYEGLRRFERTEEVARIDSAATLKKQRKYLNAAREDLAKAVANIRGLRGGPVFPGLREIENLVTEGEARLDNAIEIAARRRPLSRADRALWIGVLHALDAGGMTDKEIADLVMKSESDWTAAPCRETVKKYTTNTIRLTGLQRLVGIIKRDRNRGLDKD